MEEFTQKFGKRIETLRKQKGMTQQQLADKSGQSLKIIQRLEAGDIPAELMTVVRMSRKLNVSLQELFSAGFE